MATSYDEIVGRAETEIATFALSGWVGAIVVVEGAVWVAVKRPGGEEVVEQGPLSTALRHYTSSLRQAANRTTSL
ncbi:hypothetical protein [Actinomadura terrae]|uniref:hypothetical protein n=1 Tax=Actinomadura terrae TaxID=604353 RepID=UPI001FA6B500|nr:hypothetical protein [Actinomadura terrae]